MVDETGSFVERRKYPRIKALHLVAYSASDGGIQKFPAAIGRTLDISSAGARLEVYQYIAPDTALEVEIAVGNDIFATPGKYIHSSMIDQGIYIVGIEFDRLHPDIVALIDDAADDRPVAPQKSAPEK
jgi:hypothetical protein